MPAAAPAPPAPAPGWPACWNRPAKGPRPRRCTARSWPSRKRWPLARADAGLGEAERAKRADDYGRLALEYLDRSIRLGQRDREHMAMDADLDPLRDRPDFQALMADLDKRFPGKPVAPTRVVLGL